MKKVVESHSWLLTGLNKLTSPQNRLPTAGSLSVLELIQDFNSHCEGGLGPTLSYVTKTAAPEGPF